MSVIHCPALHCDHRLTGTRRKIKRYALLFFLLNILIIYIFISSKPSFSNIQNPKKGFRWQAQNSIFALSLFSLYR